MRAVTATAAVVAALATGATALAGLHGSSTTVNVTMKEWGAAPVPAKVKPGTVVFRVKNAGMLSHQFIVLKTNTPAAKLPLKGTQAVLRGPQWIITELKPGKTHTLTLTLAKGTYVLLCNLPTHYKSGQFASFTVG